MKKKLSKVVKALKTGVAQCIPQAYYHAKFAKLYKEHSAALCLHRVTDQRRATDPYPDNTFIEKDLLTLLDLLYRLMPAHHLVITFDDGYLDAIQFVSTYASRYERATFLIFICPEKTALQAGFRWDLFESLSDDRSFVQVLNEPVDISEENHRADLRSVGKDPRFRLATVQEVKALTSFPNVKLGNHSNCHFNFAKMPEATWKKELGVSFQLFTQLFGPTEHFAFPFGTPSSQFTSEQARFIKEHYDVKVWSTAKGGNAMAGNPVYLNRFPLPGHLPLKWQLFMMCR